MSLTPSEIREETVWLIAKCDHLINRSETHLATLRERRAKLDQVLADLEKVKDGPGPVAN
jgi:hypothetical protein